MSEVLGRPPTPSLLDGPKTILLEYPALAPSPCTNNDLPTPSSTDENDSSPSARARAVVQAIKLRRSGRLRAWATPAWGSFSLSQAEYRQLLRTLRSDTALWAYVKDKVRYDYFPLIGRFVLRMPSFLHEDFIHSVARDIENQLERLGRGQSPSALFARSIKRGTSLVAPEDDTYGAHVPDAFFKSRGSQFPGVVLEVSYSQKRGCLAALADDYILGSNENVRVVINLDIDYKGQKAVLSVWRPVVKVAADGRERVEVEPVVKNQVFRDVEGLAVESAGLSIALTDFASSAVLAQYQPLPSAEIFIAAADLCRYLNDAEQEHKALKQKELVVTPMVEGRQKRRRSPTPADYLSSSEQDEQHRPTKRVELLDSSFEASTVSSDEGLQSTRESRSKVK